VWVFSIDFARRGGVATQVIALIGSIEEARSQCPLQSTGGYLEISSLGGWNAAKKQAE
jgi:hypothetical protein